MTVCAVIPAAGRGTRLNSGSAKILTPIQDGRTIWDLLYAKLAPLVDHIHLILSPGGADVFPRLSPNVSISIQHQPVGMGDAIFCGEEIWAMYDTVLIVWGDQIFVSMDTLQRGLAARQPGHHAVLPVTQMAEPYVEYVFDNTRLMQVRQSREGEITMKNGFSDVGTFILNTDGLKSAWTEYLATSPRSGATGEINFLPFLPFLSAKGWQVTPLEIADATEARGINTPDDLAFFRDKYGNTP